MGLHPYECAASCQYCSEDEFRDRVADTLASMTNDELEGVAEDAPTYYPAPTGLTEAQLIIVYELADTEITIRKEV